MGACFPGKNFEIWKIGDALSSILVIEESAVKVITTETSVICLSFLIIPNVTFLVKRRKFENQWPTGK